MIVSVWKPFRLGFIKTTSVTRGFQGSGSRRLVGFYRLWAPLYDVMMRFDPAYVRGLYRMIECVVRDGDSALDVGCGTGLGTVRMARVADRVVAVDSSPDMLARLRGKVGVLGLGNVEIRQGFFPEVVSDGECFDSVVSSFMVVHLLGNKRVRVFEAMFRCLVLGGRLGLFSAQGEVASAFFTRGEVERDLVLAGFSDVSVVDFSDIYRIVTAVKSGR